MMKHTIAQSHDAAYKRLFSHPEMVADLLRHWVSEPWARQVRLETLRRLPSEFVTGALRRRASDCVWRFELAGGEEFCLLLEFQSSVDRWMALRMLTYVSQLHEQALRLNKISRVLSRIASAVVYNGRRSWNAPREFAELLDGDFEEPSDLFVRFRYLLVDGEGEGKRDDLVGLLFSLERAGQEDFPRLIRKLAKRLEAPAHTELRRSFEAWLNAVLLPRRFDEGLTIESLEDAMIHLPERISWKEEARLAAVAEGRQEGLAEGRQEGLAEGRQEGLAEGRQEGLRDGRLDLARSILERRFGKLPGKAWMRLRDADPAQLTQWTERAFSCRTLGEVFEE